MTRTQEKPSFNEMSLCCISVSSTAVNPLDGGSIRIPKNPARSWSLDLAICHIFAAHKVLERRIGRSSSPLAVGSDVACFNSALLLLLRMLWLVVVSWWRDDWCVSDWDSAWTLPSSTNSESGWSLSHCPVARSSVGFSSSSSGTGT